MIHHVWCASDFVSVCLSFVCPVLNVNLSQVEQFPSSRDLHKWLRTEHSRARLRQLSQARCFSQESKSHRDQRADKKKVGVGASQRRFDFPFASSARILGDLDLGPHFDTIQDMGRSHWHLDRLSRIH